MGKNLQLEIYKELENTFKEMYTNLANHQPHTSEEQAKKLGFKSVDEMNQWAIMFNDQRFINEAEEDKETKDEKLEQMLSDLDDSARLLHDKFRELKENEDQIKKSNYNTSDEYNKIQAETLNDSMLSIRTTIVNIGRLYQYFTKYVTKYGFIDVNDKSQNKNLKESDSKYDNMKYYPDSKLHPLVQHAIKSEFESLNKFFPGITDIDCKYDNHRHTIYFIYKGKKYSFRLDLNGDTRTYVNKMVKRLIAPKPNKVSFIKTYR